jgi:hypothetical protein
MAARVFDRGIKGEVLTAETIALEPAVTGASLLRVAVQAVAAGAKHQVFHRTSSAAMSTKRTGTAPVRVIG